MKQYSFIKGLFLNALLIGCIGGASAWIPQSAWAQNSKQTQEAGTSKSIPVGSTEKLISSLTGDVVWSSSDSETVLVSSNGYIHALTAGKAQVTARAGEKEESFSIQVNGSITLIDKEPYLSTAPTFSELEQYEKDVAQRKLIKKEPLEWLSGYNMLIYARSEDSNVTVQYLVGEKKKDLLPYITIVFNSPKEFAANKMKQYIAEHYIPATGKDIMDEDFNGWAKGDFCLEYRELTIDESSEPVINLQYAIADSKKIMPGDIVLTIDDKEDIALQTATENGFLWVNWGKDEWEVFDNSSAPNVKVNVKGKMTGSKIQLLGGDITQLHCYNNHVSALQAQTILPKLNVLSCYSNSLKNIDLTNMPSLEDLNCSDNNFETLDVSALPKLSSLNVSNNKIASIDLSQNKELVSLSLLGNMAVERIDLSACPLLEDVSLGYNKLTALDLSHNPKVFFVTVYKNKMSADALKALYETLPNRPDKDGTLKVLFSKDDEEPEGNVVNPQDIAIANQKGWKVMDDRKEIETGVEKVETTELVKIYNRDNKLYVEAAESFHIYGIDGEQLYQGYPGQYSIELPHIFKAVLRTDSGKVYKLSL